MSTSALCSSIGYNLQRICKFMRENNYHDHMEESVTVNILPFSFAQSRTLIGQLLSKLNSIVAKLTGIRSNDIQSQLLLFSLNRAIDAIQTNMSAFAL